MIKIFESPIQLLDRCRPTIKIDGPFGSTCLFDTGASYSAWQGNVKELVSRGGIFTGRYMSIRNYDNRCNIVSIWTVKDFRLGEIVYPVFPLLYIPAETDEFLLGASAFRELRKVIDDVHKLFTVTCDDLSEIRSTVIVPEFNTYTMYCDFIEKVSCKVELIIDNCNVVEKEYTSCNLYNINAEIGWNIKYHTMLVDCNNGNNEHNILLHVKDCNNEKAASILKEWSTVNRRYDYEGSFNISGVRRYQ